MINNPQPNQAQEGWTNYFVVTEGYTAYATPTDMLELVCPANILIEVMNGIVSANNTAAAIVNMIFLSREVANTGGTSSNLDVKRYNTNDVASLAAVKLYTAAPVLGTLFCNLANIRANIPSSASIPGTFNYTSSGAIQNLSRELPGSVLATLHPGESFAINFDGAVLPAGFSGKIGLAWRERNLS